MCAVVNEDGVICVTDVKSATYKRDVLLAQQRQFLRMWEFPNMQLAVNAQDQLCVLVRTNGMDKLTEVSLRLVITGMSRLLVGEAYE